MKRLLAVILAVAIAVGLYAATAGGTQQAVTPGQFNALKKQVAKLQKNIDAVNTVLVSCVMGQAVPVSRYSGYIAHDMTGAQIDTTALDITNTGDTPNGYVLVVSSDPNCLSLINQTSLHKLFSAGSASARPGTFSRAVTHR